MKYLVTGVTVVLVTVMVVLVAGVVVDVVVEVRKEQVTTVPRLGSIVLSSHPVEGLQVKALQENAFCSQHLVQQLCHVNQRIIE